MLRFKMVTVLWFLFVTSSYAQEKVYNCIQKGLNLVIEHDLELKFNKKEDVIFILNFYKGSDAYKLAVVTKSSYYSLSGAFDYYPKGVIKYQGFDCLIFGDIPPYLNYTKSIKEFNFLFREESENPNRNDKNLPPSPPIYTEPNVYVFRINAGCSVVSIRKDDSVFSM
ncbi:MAG TPA: hypothetical protein VJ951_00565 [Bacteroidales bacterium]|nr:hypothetical protein [Bacteroidales bacterium]